MQLFFEYFMLNLWNDPLKGSVWVSKQGDEFIL